MMQKGKSIDAPSRGARHVCRTRGLVLAALSFGVAWVPDTAQATPPTPVEMTLTLGTRVVNSRRSAGDNLILTQTTAATLSGVVEGAYIYEMRLVLHLPTGTGNYELTGTFEGTVDGKYGTMVLEARGTIDGATQRCEWQAGHGTDELAGVHMQGQCEGPNGGPIPMWGLVHFDP